MRLHRFWSQQGQPGAGQHLCSCLQPLDVSGKQINGWKLKGPIRVSWPFLPVSTVFLLMCYGHISRLCRSGRLVDVAGYWCRGFAIWPRCPGGLQASMIILRPRVVKEAPVVPRLWCPWSEGLVSEDRFAGFLLSLFSHPKRLH